MPSLFVKPQSIPRSLLALIFIAVVGIATRLIWIDQPYTDNWSWRQSDVAAIARNFYSGGYHFAYPQIDWAGNQPGHVGTEFPILPFAAAICYNAFGVHEWVGRVQAVIFFTISLPFFFLLVREISDELSAIWALFFYAFAPLNVFTGREFMPDVPSLSLSIVGLYYFVRWIDSNAALSPPTNTGPPTSKYFIFSATCISLSILIKLTSLLIGVPLVCLVLQRFEFGALRQVRLWVFAAIALVPSILWYGHAYDIALKYYPHHFFGAGGVRLMSLPWYWRILREIANSSLTIPLFVLSVIGIVSSRRSPRAHLFHWWLGAIAIFIVVVGYGNRHQWYQLPLVPIAAAFGGLACSFLAQRFPTRIVGIGLAVATVVASCSFLAAKPLYHSRASTALRDLGLALKTATPPDALIVAADNGDPTVFYYAERKGWHFLEKDGIFQGDPLTGEQAIADLEQLRQRGANYLAFTWATVWWLDYYKEFAEYVKSNATVMQASPEFRIYKLQPSSK